MLGPERFHNCLDFFDLRPLPRFAHSLEIVHVNTYARFAFQMHIINVAPTVSNLLQLSDFGAHCAKLLPISLAFLPIFGPTSLLFSGLLNLFFMFAFIRFQHVFYILDLRPHFRLPHLHEAIFVLKCFCCLFEACSITLPANLVAAIMAVAAGFGIVLLPMYFCYLFDACYVTLATNIVAAVVAVAVVACCGIVVRLYWQVADPTCRIKEQCAGQQ